jgi:hypothetical protein
VKETLLEDLAISKHKFDARSKNDMLEWCDDEAMHA